MLTLDKEKLKLALDSMTPTERRLYEELSDGQPHFGDPLLRAAFDDELSDRVNLLNMLSNLRPKIRPLGLEVIAQSFGRHSRHRLIKVVTREEVMPTDLDSQC